MDRGARRLDGRESLPGGLEPILGAPPSLQWILNALAKHGYFDSTYIGGYHLEKVVEFFPDLKVRFFRRWQECGDLAALSELVVPTSRDLLLVRAEIVLLPTALDKLDHVARQQGSASTIYAGFVHSNIGHNVCLMHIPAGRLAEVIEIATALSKADSKANFGALVDCLPEVVHIDLADTASCANDSKSLRRLIFQGKALTLEQLSELIRSAVVPPQLRFRVQDWFENHTSVLSNIGQAFTQDLLIVRSSTAEEDSVASSGAGRFHSQLDIDATDSNAVMSGIERVIASYQRDGRSIDNRDEILIQEQIRSLDCSGVLLTRDPSSGAPYYVINYECESGRSDVVTSGVAGKLHTIFQSWDSPVAHMGSEIRQLVTLAAELRNLTYDDALDIEFGRDKSGTLYLFQVRPMTMRVARRDLFDGDLGGIRRAAADHFRERCSGHPSLLGSGVLFANMSDWNPAEMIGAEPNPLALSLYQLLVGDWAWAEARARIGYRDVGPEPLIHSFGGRPYVDVKASLNSFLPSGLDEQIGSLWVDDCIARLRVTPSLQDKIEFDVTVTCLAFDWEKHALRMAAAGLSSMQIDNFRRLLANLTQKIVIGTTQPISDQLSLVAELDTFRSKCSCIEVPNAPAAARKVQMLLDRCTRLGVIPFAILARYGFIAMSFIRSLRDIGIFSSAESDKILRSIPTVASQFTKDLYACSAGHKSLFELVADYGHLRPHSYDITSRSYADQPEMLLSGAPRALQTDLSWTDIEALFSSRADQISGHLKTLGLQIDITVLINFIRSAIIAREQAKFTFMKTVNDSLESIAAFGGFLDLSRDDLSYLHVNDVLRFARESLSGATPGRLRRIITYRRKRQDLTRALRLPDVLVDVKDFDGFEQYEGKPNFVTRGRIIAPVFRLEQFEVGLSLAGKIVAIRSADPGFDWIFGHAIVGLITEYGGVASHMAIRAAEFGLPAAIGCGSVIFENALLSSRIELDCVNERIISR
jgi:hypothetical protein